MKSENISGVVLLKKINLTLDKTEIYFFVKRTIDVILSLMIILTIWPVLLLVCVMIKIDSKGPAVYRQIRIGKNGKLFSIYKFRTMVINADDILEELLKDEKIKEEYKKKMKLPNDPRITKVGKILRKTSLDEIPQVFNVLKGEMSLIGNRPYLPREKNDMDVYYKQIIKTKPGISGYWQVSGRSNTTFKERCILESYYSNNVSFLFDLKIFFKTFYVVFTRKGAE